MRRGALGIVAALVSFTACQALLDFDPDVVVPGAADGSADVVEPPNDTGAETQASPFDAPRQLWNIGATASGVATTATDLFWIVDKTIFAQSKQVPDGAPPRSATIDCQYPLAGPVADGSRAFAACGRSPQGNVLRYEWNGGQAPVPTNIFNAKSDVLALAASAGGTGMVFTYPDVDKTYCCYALDAPPPAWIPCTPRATAAANERAFYYVDNVGAIVSVSWSGGVGAPLAAPIAGVASISATDEALYLAGTGGLARLPLQDGGATVVDDKPSTLVIASRERIAFVRGGRVWVTSADLAAPVAVSPEAHVPEHPAIDADGVYWKGADWLWVAPFCPGTFCTRK